MAVQLALALSGCRAKQAYFFKGALDVYMSLFICRCLLARFDGRQVLLMHLPLLPNRLPARQTLLYLGLKGQSFVIKTS